MKIVVSSIFVDDQDKALEFYTNKLGFVKKTEIPMGDARWVTVVAPSDPNGTELLLEPDSHPRQTDLSWRDARTCPLNKIFVRVREPRIPCQPKLRNLITRVG